MFSPYNADIFSYEPWNPRIFSICNHHTCLSASFEYAHYINILLFRCGYSLYTSESDVCRRQILTYKDGPRAERVNEMFEVDMYMLNQQDLIIRGRKLFLHPPYVGSHVSEAQLQVGVKFNIIT